MAEHGEAGGAGWRGGCGQGGTAERCAQGTTYDFVFQITQDSRPGEPAGSTSKRNSIKTEWGNTTNVDHQQDDGHFSFPAAGHWTGVFLSLYFFVQRMSGNHLQDIREFGTRIKYDDIRLVSGLSVATWPHQSYRVQVKGTPRYPQEPQPSEGSPEIIGKRPMTFCVVCQWIFIGALCALLLPWLEWESTDSDSSPKDRV